MCSGRASGGPTARAPHAPHPSPNPPSQLAPQHGQMFKVLAPFAFTVRGVNGES
jgi:hypothetical protein